MNLTGVTCIKNEADIVEAFVRHNLCFLDRLIVLDHGSTDDTPAILHSLKREGLALEVVRDDNLGKFQGEKMTSLMRKAAREGADWIFLLDGDEFIKTPGKSPISLPGKGDRILKIAIQTYCARSDDDPSEINPVIRIQHRLASEPFQNRSLEDRRYYLHCVVPCNVALAPECRVLQGNHQVLLKGVEAEYAFCGEFSLAHYSLRSPGQYASKIAIGSLQHLASTSLSVPGDSFYIPHLEALQSDFEVFRDDFYHRIPAYIELRNHPLDKISDPLLYKGGPLKYTVHLSDTATLTSNLLGYSESLARRLGQLPSRSNDSGKVAAHLTLKTRSAPELILASLPCLLHNFQIETVYLPLEEWNGRDPLVLEISAPTSYIEFTSLSFLRKDGSSQKASGDLLRKTFKILSKAQDVYHRQYFTFVKSISPSELVLNLPRSAPAKMTSGLNLSIRLDSNPAIIGLRFFQEDPFVREEAALKKHRSLQQKFNESARLRNFLRHHLVSFCKRIFRRGLK